jgi:hypothetical protein
VVVRRNAILATVAESLLWRRWPSLFFAGLLVLAFFFLVRLISAEPMDGDAGLYRLGAINYASTYGTVPGLANLQDRFGFNSSVWPLAALLGNGLWKGEGFRLVSGLFASVLLWSTFARVVIRRRGGRTAGDWFMVVGTCFTIAMILTDTGRWVPSPSQDLIVLVVSVVSSGFLLDYIWKREGVWNAAMAVILAAVVGSVRPLGWVLALITCLVLLWLTSPWSSGPVTTLREWIEFLVPPAMYAGALLAVMMARDVVLSGWIFFPSSVMPIDVPWRTKNPIGLAQWVTSWGRAPWQNKDVVLASSDWFKPWLAGFRSSREVYLSALMGLAVVVPACWRRGRAALIASARQLMWVWPPTLLMGAVWFITAPDVRFGWPAFVGLAGIPLALVLAHGAYPAALARIAGLAILSLMLVSNILNGRVLPRGAPPQEQMLRWGALTIPVMLGPAAERSPIPGKLGDDTPIVYAADGACWNLFPLCLLKGEGADAYRLGPDISDGFATTAR